MKRICWKTHLLALLTLSLATCNGGGSSGGGGSPPPSPQLTALDPAANERAAALDTTVDVEFDQPMNVGDGSTFVVDGSLSGKLVGPYSGGETTTLSFTPDNDLKPGEGVEVTLTTGITSAGGAALDPPFVYRFRAAVAGGDATFVSAGTVPVGSVPFAIVTGDWDGDGDLDLAVTDLSTFEVRVLLNNGSGDFSQPPGIIPPKMGSEPVAITSGDWDGDGDLDLAVVEEFTGEVTVLLNDGAGVFSDAGISPIIVQGQPVAITSGDWDGDGDLDLAVTNFSTFKVTVLLNDGIGDFSKPGGISAIDVGSEPVSIAAGDWDGDGDLDLAVTNLSTFEVTVLLNDGSGVFSDAGISPVKVGSEPVAITSGDWDGDGDLDLAVVEEFTGEVTVLLNDGDGVFSEPVGVSPIIVQGQPVAITSGDWDGDGDLDLAVTNFSTFKVTVLLNDGIGDFSKPGGISAIDVGSEPVSIAAGDWDGDGDLDLAVVNQLTFNMTLLFNRP